MDKMSLEAKMLDYQHFNFPSTSKTVIGSGIGIGALMIGIRFWGKRDYLDIALSSCCVLGGFAIVVIGTNRWLFRQAKKTKNIVECMDKARMALKKRQQICFSVSMRVPRANLLIRRCCRIAADAIQIISEEAKATQFYVLEPADQMWSDLYTSEIEEILIRDPENEQKLRIEKDDDSDFDVIFETLIAMFRLHLSEYCKFVIISILDSQSSFGVFGRVREFRKTILKMNEVSKLFKDIERTALRGNSNDNTYKAKKFTPKFLNLEWNEQIIIALESVLEELRNGKMTRNETEIALRRTLTLMIGIQQDSLKNEKVDEDNSVKVELEAGIDSGNEVEIKMERTDIDMVFEGVTLSEDDKNAMRNTCVRDVLLDGCESRRHEANLLGELQMVLEPRRNDFVKRERTALAKFYGIDEEELEKRENENKEENFEGTGEGNDDVPDTYDWRLDAEQSFGIHKTTQDSDFLAALASRFVKDDVIE